jgi:hypothetical protein
MPGRWTIRSTATSATVRNPPTTTIDITTFDVSNLLLVLPNGTPAIGRVIIDGLPGTSLPGDFEQARLFLRPIIPEATTFTSGAISRNGAFEVAGITAGTYRLEGRSMPGNYYVRMATLNGTDVLSKAADFVPGREAVLEVTVGADGGQIMGTIVDEQDRPAGVLMPALTAFLIPADRQRFDLYKTATADSSGRFAIRGVPPGTYKLFSWGVYNNNDQYDPEVIKKWESRGVLVLVQPNGQIQADPRALYP